MVCLTSADPLISQHWWVTVSLLFILLLFDASSRSIMSLIRLLPNRLSSFPRLLDNHWICVEIHSTTYHPALEIRSLVYNIRSLDSSNHPRIFNHLQAFFASSANLQSNIHHTNIRPARTESSCESNLTYSNPMIHEFARANPWLNLAQRFPAYSPFNNP